MLDWCIDTTAARAYYPPPKHSNLLTDLHNCYEEVYRQYIQTIFYGFAILANILCFYITTSKTFRNYTKCAIYMSSLAVFDTIYVVSWGTMTYLGGRSWQFHYGMTSCKALRYAYNIAAAMAPITVTLFTLARFICIYFPFVFNKHIQSGRPTITILTGAFFALVVFHLPVPLFSEPSEDRSRCIFPDTSAFKKYENVYTELDNASIFWIPSAVIIVCNALMVCYFQNRQKTSVEGVVLNGIEIPDNGGPDQPDPGEDQYSATEIRLLRVISVSFFFLQLPIFLCECAKYFLDFSHTLTLQRYIVVHDLAQVMYNLNFMLDFVIYNLASAKFRELAVRVVRDTKHRLVGSVKWMSIPAPPDDGLSA